MGTAAPPADTIDNILAAAPSAAITTNNWDRMAQLTANAIGQNVPANAVNYLLKNAPSQEITANNWNYMFKLTAADPGTNNGFIAITGACGGGETSMGIARAERLG